MSKDDEAAKAESKRDPAAKASPELRTWEQVIALYGGNSMYQLVAQDGKTHRFSAYTEKAYFAGPPRKSSRRRAR